MDCFHCSDRIDKRGEHFELHHHQADANPIRQHTFCCEDCLRQYLAT